uniref:RING-type domain-containing protein n=1 Tax=Mola mola TaxID=94237 RepID=A0A3Q3WNI6_MOLML
LPATAPLGLPSSPPPPPPPHLPCGGRLWEQVLPVFQLLETDLLQKVQAVQTDSTTEESGVNTDPDWESHLAAMCEYSTSLTEQYVSLLKTQQEEEVAHKTDMQQLQKKKEDAIRQHQVRLTHTDQVTLLSQCGTHLKPWTCESKQATITVNRCGGEAERRRYGSHRGLAERGADFRTSKSSLQLHFLCPLYKLSCYTKAIARITIQKEQTWSMKSYGCSATDLVVYLSQLAKYLNTLRVEFPQQYPHEKQQWDKKESVVLRNQVELQSRFQEVLQQLQQGRQLESLPRINMPSLPQIPLQKHPPDHPQYLHRYHHHVQPPKRFPHNFQNPLSPQPQFQPQVRAPLRVTPPPSLSPSPPVQPTKPVVPSPPPTAATTTVPTVKPDKVLDKLGARFPQCNRAQLLSLLQQVKSSRGTLAGMSVEEVIEQVGFRLAQNEWPTPSSQRPAGGPRKMCLMCQNHVDPESRHPLSCSHTIHKDCIQTWLQSSKNNSCPFCPGK